MEHSICYLSKEIPSSSDSGYLDLFDSLVKFNLENNITGVLLFNEGFFLQVLEGKKEILQNLIQIIQRDSRHKEMLIILDKPINNRIFKDYSTGFSIIDNTESIKDLNSYLSLNHSGKEYPDNIRFLLEPFLL